MFTPTPRRSLKLVLAVAGLVLAAQAGAQMMPRHESTLDSLVRASERFAPTGEIAPLDDARDALAPDADLALDGFLSAAGGTWSAHVDLRTGRVTNLEGSGLAWFPGRGNSLAGGPAPTLATLDAKARALAPSLAKLFGFDPSTLVLDAGRSGSSSPDLWYVDYDVVLGGHPVEGARVVFVVGHGNLISIGGESLPATGTAAPKTGVDRGRALAALADHIGGIRLDDDWVDAGSYHLLPANLSDARFADGFEPGRGRGVAGVWQFVFRRPGEVGTFRGRVDAATGELVEFYDVNEYGSVTGGAYPGDRPAAERVLPMPFANYGSGLYSNSAGVFSGTAGTTTLVGQYVGISDSCGSISKAADANGLIALGSSAGTDCTTPGSGGAGNTHASRTQFYALNRAKEAARGWLPSNSWINARLTANVNLNQTCNAYWNGSTVNFFRSGGGCANTGELPGVSLHEYGHGLDSNDGNGSSPENGSGETYGDFTAALATHASCIGNGFLGSSNCGGYGDPCTACSGVRDIDWARHNSNTPHTVANFTQSRCPTSPGYVGPCNREGHCESYIGSESLWDLAARDLPGAGTGVAWTIVDRLWYLSRSTATRTFTCTTSSSPWTSNGCNTGSLFKVFRAVDDDNGNLADGTPHGGAIAAAFNRHGIACTTDAGWNTTFAAVTPPAAPSLTVTAGSNSASLSWSGSSGVYDVYRNETGCNAGFTKAANDVAGTSYTDNAVANGFTYYYQVVAHPSGTEAAGSAPSTCRSVTPTGGTCTPPAAPTGVSASAASQTAINVSWTASSGATSYAISRATTSGGPYSQVGTSTTTSFADSGLACNTTYYYVVTASNGSCSSGNSTQASATTQACTGNVLSNGVPVNGIAGAAGSQQFWTMSVPSGASNLQFRISGGTGDADMYVRFGSPPTTTTYNCRPYLNGNNETCTFAAPQVGTYHVMLHGYTAYSGVQLLGSYATGGGCTAISDVEPNNSRTAPQAISGACNQVSGTFTNDGGQTSDYFALSLPAGRTVTALLNGLTVDYDLYIYNSTTGSAVAQSLNGGTTADQASWTNSGASAITVYVRVYRYSTTNTTYQLRVSY